MALYCRAGTAPPRPWQTWWCPGSPQRSPPTSPFCDSDFRPSVELQATNVPMGNSVPHKPTPTDGFRHRCHWKNPPWGLTRSGGWGRVGFGVLI